MINSVFELSLIISGVEETSTEEGLSIGGQDFFVCVFALKSPFTPSRPKMAFTLAVDRNRTSFLLQATNRSEVGASLGC
jgi:hypothetical protein